MIPPNVGWALVKLGEAELATEKPRRFRRAVGKPAPAAPGEGSADRAEDHSAELAGAA